MPNQIVILGCTASGKSDLAEALAQELHSPIMAVDSMQVYRGMDIGTAKPDAAARERFGYRMIDVADPWQSYSAAQFVETSREILHNPKRESPTGDRPGPFIIVAGTILYLRALIEGLFEGPSADPVIRAQLNVQAAAPGGLESLHVELQRVDPVAASRIHPNDLRRVVRALEVFRITGTAISTLQTQWKETHADEVGNSQTLYMGIRREKESLNRRINLRVKKMVEQGLVAEVERLSSDPRGFSLEAASGVGYRQVLDYFAGKCTLEQAIEQVKIQTRYLAKMQRTWLKRWPPPQQVHWLDAGEQTGGADLLPAALQVIQVAVEGKAGQEGQATHGAS